MRNPEEQALLDLMPVIDKIVGAIMHSARGDWDNVQRAWLAATDLFMDITEDKNHPVIVLYKEWLKCREEVKSAKQKARSKRAPAEKD